MRGKNIAQWIVLLVGFATVFVAQATTNLTPVGIWTAVDPMTKKSQMQIQISEDVNHVLLGKIIKVVDPRKNKTMCQSCPEDFKKQPLVGMEILWGLKKSSEYTWNEGRILIPNRGQVFECNMTMSQDGQILTMRIYLATKALIKTEMWYRAA